jgi:TatD DNase family protein
VDAHTHLDACGCVDAADVAAALDRAEAVGVTRVVTVADDLASARWVVDAAQWDDRVVAAVALHPTRTASVTNGDLAEIERLAAAPRVVAVGETGLDHYWDYSPWDAQERAFRWHIDLAKRLGKPLMIHDRDAHADVLRVLDEEGAPDAVVFHCFSGAAAMARTCVDAGYLLSFAGPVTFTNAAALREAAALVPDDRLLVETDAPFLTPHPHRGRANEPYCLPWTVRTLAAVRGVPAERIADCARRNAESVFGLRDAPPVRRSGARGTRST